MKRDELRELHYITVIVNIPSMLTHGILSHNRGKQVQHVTVAMPEIQERREKVRVPGGRPLHDYANLYFHARNPMMYKRKELHANLCVLRVSTDVLGLPGVIITDGNAASGYVRFVPAPEGLVIVDRELVFARDWRDPDQIQKYRRSFAKCAEVLVPDQVDSHYILGAYTSCPESRQALVDSLAGGTTRLDITVNGDLFFV